MQGSEGNSRHSDRNVSFFPSWSGLGLISTPVIYSAHARRRRKFTPFWQKRQLVSFLVGLRAYQHTCKILTKICDTKGNMSFPWGSYSRAIYFRGPVRLTRNCFTDPRGSCLNKQECLQVGSIDLTVHVVWQTPNWGTENRNETPGAEPFLKRQ